MKKFFCILLLTTVVSCVGQEKAVTLEKDSITRILTVKCTLNGVITIPMIIDTGASITIIPMHVAQTLIDTGTLTPTDYIGKSKYVLADGSIVENYKIKLASLKLEGHEFKNVTICIGKGGAPLLLGGDILSQLYGGVITIDYNNNKIIK